MKLLAEEVSGNYYEDGPVKRMTALKVAAAELYRREGVACLEWALTLENADLSLAVMTAAAGKDPAVMKEWLVKFGGHWESWHAGGVIASAEREAAMRSEKDLLEVEVLFPGSLSGSFDGFADGFDFRSYLKTTQSSSGGEKAIRFWVARDPEGAEQGLREGLGTEPYQAAALFRGAMEGRAEMTSDTEAAAWICGIVADLTGRAREMAIGELIRGDRTRKQMQAVMEHLPTDDDRVNCTAASLRNSLGAYTPLLEALPSEAMQAEALGRWVNQLSPGMLESGERTLDQLMERLNFSEGRREELRAKLLKSE